jgi:hypothetical protein
VRELHLSAHRGDVTLVQVGTSELSTVNGDVDVGGSQSLRVTTLNGDLRVSAVQGELLLSGIRGDILLRAATGRAVLRGITGDVRIRNPEGHVDVHDVNGDVEFIGNLKSGEYSLEANGDIRLQLDRESDVRLELEAPVGSVSSALSLGEAQELPHGLQGTLGQGAAQLRAIAASGDIKVRARRSSDVEEALQEEIARVEEAARRAQERAQRMAEKMKRRGERLERQAQRRAERISQRHTLKTRVQRQSAPAEDVQKERLAVLRMLSEGKISASQAEALLSALES